MQFSPIPSCVKLYELGAPASALRISLGALGAEGMDCPRFSSRSSGCPAGGAFSFCACEKRRSLPRRVPPRAQVAGQTK
eukprot:4654053-Pyramimonas_sp.AAC.1